MSQKEREKEKVAETLFKEIMAENFLNLGKKRDMQIQEAQSVPNKRDPRRSVPRHTIIQMSKLKDNFKSSRRKTTCLV